LAQALRASLGKKPCILSVKVLRIEAGSSIASPAKAAKDKRKGNIENKVK
jgi:hypothetical protein